jgi:hypothetical protein
MWKAVKTRVKQTALERSEAEVWRIALNEKRGIMK